MNSVPATGITAGWSEKPPVDVTTPDVEDDSNRMPEKAGGKHYEKGIEVAEDEYADEKAEDSAIIDDGQATTAVPESSGKDG